MEVLMQPIQSKVFIFISRTLFLLSVSLCLVLFDSLMTHITYCSWKFWNGKNAQSRDSETQFETTLCMFSFFFHFFSLPFWIDSISLVLFGIDECEGEGKFYSEVETRVRPSRYRRTSGNGRTFLRCWHRSYHHWSLTFHHSIIRSFVFAFECICCFPIDLYWWSLWFSAFVSTLDSNTTVHFTFSLASHKHTIQSLSLIHLFIFFSFFSLFFLFFLSFFFFFSCKYIHFYSLTSFFQCQRLSFVSITTTWTRSFKSRTIEFRCFLFVWQTRQWNTQWVRISLWSKLTIRNKEDSKKRKIIILTFVVVVVVQGSTASNESNSSRHHSKQIGS